MPYAANIYREVQISLLTQIRRERKLPVPGRILRQVGDRVSSNTVIAEADVPQGYHLIELHKALGARARNMEKVLVKKIGETVAKGEVLARTGRLFRAECISPVDGLILDAREDRILIETAPQHVELIAFYPGQIAGLIPSMGLTIEITGAVVQGMWGMGNELRARIECAVPDGSTPLRADTITPGHMGTILVSGGALDAATLAAAVQNKVGGIVTGSISSSLLSQVRASPLSLLLTEGFGDMAMNASAFHVLQSYAGREGCLNPRMGTRWNQQRPELVVPLPAEGRPPAPAYGAPLEVGTQVRALCAPYKSAVGEIVSLPPHHHRLESGIKALGAEVDLESIGKVFIPFENLDIVR
jgi:hypothetical protein